ncbi:enoyl-CoA hydratase [Cypionkella sp.]|uniref:enoyl-CoA hydratase n=1 Tax=Cypionkella sp. TaxID=2811411 RepID=UPI002ABA47BC|nr:enoyl-CoA hydratase [Cypionkella sp.]MDZ4392218.1 enoyl-CoA hydratase [Cypionkella sp.]
MPETLLIDIKDHVALIRLNRPEALNALNQQLMSELATTLQAMDSDEAVRCIVITGSEKAFAAGADIREMAGKTFAEAFVGDIFGPETEAIQRIRKPSIAAVAGFARGGGCELAMMCDFILAAETAKFGQPEINLGIIAGMGGTQRLTRAVGKAKAMEMNLTGRMMDAVEAERAGLVSRIIPAADLIDEALKTAAKIAAKSAVAVRAAKESVNRAQETALREGLLLERRLFHAMFATEDQKEGMAAFLEKRPANFQDR